MPRDQIRLIVFAFVVAVLMLTGPVLFAQAAAVAGSPLEPGQANESVVSFVWAYAGAALLEWWKRSKFGGMKTSAEPYIKRGIAVATAVLSAIGVHSSFDAAAGVLTISGLTMPGIWVAIGDSVRQFAFQQFIYRAAIEDKAVTRVLNPPTTTT